VTSGASADAPTVSAQLRYTTRHVDDGDDSRRTACSDGPYPAERRTQECSDVTHRPRPRTRTALGRTASRCARPRMLNGYRVHPTTRQAASLGPPAVTQRVLPRTRAQCGRTRRGLLRFPSKPADDPGPIALAWTNNASTGVPRGRAEESPAGICRRTSAGSWEARQRPTSRPRHLSSERPGEMIDCG
jgi:hypothetical protein